MNIEEMIFWLEMHENPKYLPIIVALRAGQEMRNSVFLNHEGHEKGTYVSYVEITKSAKAWDAITVGDSK